MENKINKTNKMAECLKSLELKVKQAVDEILPEAEKIRNLFKDYDEVMEALNDVKDPKKPYPKVINDIGDALTVNSWNLKGEYDDAFKRVTQNLGSIETLAYITKGLSSPKEILRVINEQEKQILGKQYKYGKHGPLIHLTKETLDYGLIEKERELLDKVYEEGKKYCERKGYNPEREIAHGLSHLLVWSYSGGSEKEKEIPAEVYKIRIEGFKVLYNKVVNEWENAPLKSPLITRFIGAYDKMRETAESKNIKLNPRDFGLDEELLHVMWLTKKGDDEYALKDIKDYGLKPLTELLGHVSLL